MESSTLSGDLAARYRLGGSLLSYRPGSRFGASLSESSWTERSCGYAAGLSRRRSGERTSSTFAPCPTQASGTGGASRVALTCCRSSCQRLGAESSQQDGISMGESRHSVERRHNADRCACGGGRAGQGRAAGQGAACRAGAPAPTAVRVASLTETRAPARAWGSAAARVAAGRSNADPQRPSSTGVTGKGVAGRARPATGSLRGKRSGLEALAAGA
jgi:hypothetical protein